MSAIDAVTEPAVESLHEQTHGPVLHPGDEGYTEARTVFNAMIDKYPSIIVRAEGPADVMTAVDFARTHDLLLSVKGGGHNFAGTAVSDDGLTIDLSQMDFVRVDPDEQRAVVGPGCEWADVDHETQAHGLATTGGLVSHTGVAGLTLGGGQGYLARHYGLTCDNLVGADVVTAAGELVHASEAENPDLFWALRGGGGNFGVVTAFEFELHEVGPELLGGLIVHPYEDAQEGLEFYREFTTEAPNELACYALFARVPPEEPFPERYQGEPALNFAVCYDGPIEEGEAVLEPLREFGDPILDGTQPKPYTALQAAFDDGSPPGYRWYTKSHYLEDLPEQAIDTMLDYTDPYPGPLTQVALEPLGGAVAERDPQETAFAHRDAEYSLGIWPCWGDSGMDEELINWARDFHDAMRPYASGVYSNYLDRDELDRLEAAFGQNYERLREVKAKWDPENLFRVNTNIEPAA
jgi:FAD/FMN-containing dehydrogenase